MLDNLHDNFLTDDGVDYFSKKTLEYLQDTIDLPKREELFEDIKKNINKPGKHAHTVILIAIDDYDDISDYFGVDISKKLLFQFAEWLKDNLPNRSAKLYAFEANKFVIYITGRTKVQDINSYVKSLSSKITKKSFIVDESIYSITISIGVARGRQNIFRRSYLALSHAKKADKPYIIYCHKEKIEEKFLKNIQIHQEVKTAIEENRIIPFFQPIYNTKNNSIEKYEALMRIKNSDGTYKTPIEFMDVAKKVKLYTLLTKKMISASLKQLQKIKTPININLSIEDIENQAISRYIYKAISKSGLGKYVTFEIVETQEISSFIKVTNFIKKMKKLGCKFAVDDFGSGYSNFEHILKLDIDYLKIDGSLVKNIDTSKECEIFVKTIINFAKELGIKTVAEYVYNKSVYDKVNSLGIDYVQGYYIGKPKSLSI